MVTLSLLKWAWTSGTPASFLVMFCLISGDYIVKTEFYNSKARTVTLSKGQMVVYETDLTFDNPDVILESTTSLSSGSKTILAEKYPFKW